MLKQNYVKLQPICFVSELAFQPLELYWKSNHSPKPNCIGRSLQLFPGTEIDCTTLYNSFSYKKWCKYTGLSSLYLQLFFQGKIKVQFFQYTMYQAKIIATKIAEKEILSGQLVPFYLQGQPDIVGIKILSLTDTTLYSGEFLTEHIPALREDCKLAINMCTYNRHSDVDRNLQNIVANIFLDKHHCLNHHLEVFITDNGSNYVNTFPAFQDRIHLQYCDELGSAGGFSLGAQWIMESESKRFDYIIFMDDDIAFPSTVLERTYLFLRCVLPQYRDYSLGGAFMRLTTPEFQHESGALWNNGNIISVKPNLDMRELRSILWNEVEEVTEYMGWWYCCIPTCCIREKGYPLPIYFHRDDVEFGLRNKNQFTLNGICVWHVTPDQRPSSVNKYYDARNMAIVNSIHAPKKSRNIFLSYLWKNFFKEIFRYRYLDAQLLLCATKDFCRGKDWVVNNDCGQFYNMIKSQGYQFKKIYSFDLSLYQKEYSRPSLFNRVFKLILLNGIFFPSKRKQIIVPAFEPHFEQFWLARTALNYNEFDGTGYVVKKQIFKTIKLIFSLLCITVYITIKFKAAEESWRKYLYGK